MSAFSPDSRFLVSASADDTCKVWRVADGQRMDTLPQPLKAEYTCTFSPDGRTIVAAGADNNIRVWRFVSREAGDQSDGDGAIRHEGAIVRLAFTPDGTKLVSLAEDRTIKVWRTSDYSELKLWENQPDVASALAFGPDGDSFEVGRMDGSLAILCDPGRRYRSSPRTQTRPELPSQIRPGPTRMASEHEPNNDPTRPTGSPFPRRSPAAVDAGSSGGPDFDYFRFTARAGEPWVFEVNAARSSSKLDSYLEILDGQRPARPAGDPPGGARLLFHVSR